MSSVQSTAAHYIDEKELALAVSDTALLRGMLGEAVSQAEQALAAIEDDAVR